MYKIGTGIRHFRKLKKMTLEGLAVPAGTDTGNLSRIERNMQLPNEELLLKIADVLGVNPQRLLQYEYLEAEQVELAPPLRTFRDVPIVGTVQGGDNGFFTELEYPVGHGDGNITYPAKDGATYALRVKGDSMRPRIKNGEFIVIEPHHEPQPGDDVVVCLHDGRKLVKELLYTRDGEVTLGSINNGHGNLTFTLAEIEKIHYVAAIVPRGAFYKPGSQ